MRTARGSLAVLTLSAFSAVFSPLFSQGPARPAVPPKAAPSQAAPARGRPSTAARLVLEYDQTTGTLRRDSTSNSNVIEFLGGDTIRLRKPARIQVRVVHTNTALYDLAVTDTVQHN